MTETSHFRWLETGEAVLAGMLDAIEKAQRSISLEMYIFQESPLADGFRDALIAARKRGVRVRVLVDSLGSVSLADNYWNDFRAAGGEFKWFNPFAVFRLSFRNHRKSLICDETVAFIGGVNIAPEYKGDGISSGWRDLGLRITGPCVTELMAEFEQMFAGADLKLKIFPRLRKSKRQKTVDLPDGHLLLAGPGRNNPLRKTLGHDLKRAHNIRIICAYFLPPRPMRRALIRAAKLGGKVQLILPGKSDVAMSQMAARSLYRRLLRAGVEIYEYQPQILHAKLFLLDDIILVGSANLDARSLTINYELLLRLTNRPLMTEAQNIFDRCLPHCRKIDLATWGKERTVWMKVKSKFAYFVLAKLDPFIARYQWRGLKQK